MGILSAKSQLVPTGSPGLPPKSPSPETPAVPDWTASMRLAIRDAGELCRQVQLPEGFLTKVATKPDFPVFVPREYLARIELGNGDDPLLRQVLPLKAEDHSSAEFIPDPLRESTVSPHAGIVRKYQGRALLIMTGTCAVHCRYCFRQHFPYETRPAGRSEWEAAFAYLADDPSIEEVILSGGDPLALTDAYLQPFVARLAAIPHLRRLRVHTRLPIMIPGRVTECLLRLLRNSRLTPIMVLHINHPQEIDNCVAEAIGKLVDRGIPVLNQTVLLRGVNDQVAALIGLSRRLVDLRVMPYYLHQLDRVAGAAHFEVPMEEGRRLIESMRRQLPGYAVPRYVTERPGEPSKSLIA